MAFGEPFDREFAIDHRNDHTPIAGRERTVYDQDIARVNPRLPHGLPRHTHKEGGGGMLNEMLIEVQGAIEVIIRWGGIASRDGDEKQQTGIGAPLPRYW